MTIDHIERRAENIRDQVGFQDAPIEREELRELLPLGPIEVDRAG